jgi:hypothetical protein
VSAAKTNSNPDTAMQEGTKMNVKKKLLGIPALIALALALFAAPAMAAPVLETEVSRTPEEIHRGDQFASYKIKVSNVSPTDYMNGSTVTAFISMPAGMQIAKASASGWSCDLVTRVCTTNYVAGPGKSLPEIDLSQVWIDEAAPDSPQVKVVVSGGGTASASVGTDTFTFLPRKEFGLEVLDPKVEDEAGQDYTQAGGHPFSASAEFRVPTIVPPDGFSQKWGLPVESIKSGFAELPPGLLGNPQAAKACAVDVMLAEACPPDSAVGGVILFLRGALDQEAPVYRVVTEPGYPAEFGFTTDSPKFVIRVGVRTDGDYGINILAPKVPQSPQLIGTKFSFCSNGPKVRKGFLRWEFAGCKTLGEAAKAAKPIVTMPTNCSDPEPTMSFGLDSWENPARLLPDGTTDVTDPNWKTLTSAQPAFTGCDKLVETWVDPATAPTVDLQPDTTATDSPAGYTARVHVDNEGLTDLEGLSASHLRDITVTLPEGVTMNPAIGDGVQSCTMAQMGLKSLSPLAFDKELPRCPLPSKLGTAEVVSPLLESPLHGSVYLASQYENPFGSDYAIYLAVESPEQGLVIKLAGEVVTNPVTGRATTHFRNNPELPFEDMKLSFYGGDASALANPMTCAPVATESQLTPWAAANPDQPRPDEIANSRAPVAMTSGPGGTPCANTPAERPFKLGMSAGSLNPIAGATSPFSVRITRPDGAQELSELAITSPPGFSAYLKGIPACGQAQVAAAKAKTGVAERQSPSCSAASRIGSMLSGVGPGGRQLYAAGSIYLGGPYGGAPISLITITPALAGGTEQKPAFDLGNVVVQVPLTVNRQTAQITGRTDALPEIIRGIPLRIRDVRVNLDRPQWGLNPTSCTPSNVTVVAKGNSGAVTEMSQRFQVAGCDKLAFKPKMTAKLIGGTKRGALPRFEAKVTFPHGGFANAKKVQVALPHSVFLEQSNIRTVCTRAQAAAKECPAGSIYGFAEAETPLLDGKLTGPVFLKSSTNTLPDLAIFLKGPDSQPIEVEFQGRIDSVRGGIRNTFENLPDVPVSNFTLKMKGGKNKGLLVNSRNICAGKRTRMSVHMVGQNNATSESRPRLFDSCKKKKRAKSKKKRAVKKSNRPTLLSNFVAISR